MSQIVQRQRCAAQTKAGKPCKAWAVHDEKYCSAHLGLNVGAGAPLGNQNARKHGFYADSFTVSELIDVMDLEGETDLNDEVAMLRVMNRRVMQWVKREQEGLDSITSGELSRLLTALSSSSRAIARLIKDIEREGGADNMDDVLDALSEELGIEL